MHLLLVELATILGLLGGHFLAIEVGRWLGRLRARAGDLEADGAHIGAIQGALLGLLGLLLGFSFSGASSRFVERQQLLVSEANAIGTADLRADLLPEPSRGELRALLADYVDRRKVLQGTFGDDQDQVIEELAGLQRRMWSAALRGVESNPAAAVVVLPSCNDVFDELGANLAAVRRHLPLPMLLLLVASGMLTLGAVGFGRGIGNARTPWLERCFALLVAATLWMTIDLDYPRVGLIRMDDQALTSYVPIARTPR
jgi:hypothetical protein